MCMRIIITGGTFDKQYDEIKGELTFKDSHLPKILEQARVTAQIALEINQLTDSLYMTDEHRQRVPDDLGSRADPGAGDDARESVEFIDIEMEGDTSCRFDIGSR